MSSQASAVATALGVVVVAATAVRRARLTHVLESRGIAVLATASDAPGTVAALADCSPDAMVVDLAVHSGGLDVVEHVMAERPLPILLTGAAADSPAEALAAGAADVLGSLHERSGQAAFGSALSTRLTLLSRVRVITHPRSRLRERGLVDLGAYSGSVSRHPSSHPVPPAPVLGGGRLPIVVIGASTGGPPALGTLLGGLPADFPAAVVVVQHMAEGFVSGLARWLDGCSPLPVTVAEHGQRLRAGHVVVAPNSANLLLDHGPSVRLVPAPAGQLNVPGIDVTFASVAAFTRGRAVGVLLTGMGRDGAVGLATLRASGAATIAQDEATSAVWGMPAAAGVLDAVDLELALPVIADGIIDAVRRLAPVPVPVRSGS